jgi:hypothetical protein
MALRQARSTSVSAAHLASLLHRFDMALHHHVQTLSSHHAWSVTRNLCHSDCIIRTEPVGRLHGTLRTAIGRTRQPSSGLSLTRFRPLALHTCMHACMHGSLCRDDEKAKQAITLFPRRCFSPFAARAREGFGGQRPNDATPVCSVVGRLRPVAKGIAIGKGQVSHVGTHSHSPRVRLQCAVWIGGRGEVR